MPGTELSKWVRVIKERMEVPEGEREKHVFFMFEICLCVSFVFYVLFMIKHYVYIQLVPASSFPIFEVLQ